MTKKDIEAFRRRTNAIRLQAALSDAGIRSRILSQGDGAIWVVFCDSENYDAAYEVCLSGGKPKGWQQPGSTFERICEAIDAVHAAGSKLAAACPNGRDYYPEGAEATGNAMREHEARMLKLKSVADELQTIAEALGEAVRS